MPVLEMEIKQDQELAYNRVSQPLHIMKFGGTSVGNFRAVERTAHIISKSIFEGKSIVVVVSAAQNVTDKLVKVCDLIHQDPINLGDWLQDILVSHFETISNLKLTTPQSDTLRRRLGVLYGQLRNTTANLKEMTAEQQDLILSYGEKFNHHIVAAKLQDLGIQAEPVDATEIIETDNNFGEARPNLEKTQQYAVNKLHPMLNDGITPVVTGFIGATRDYRVTTLGRGGSDYTASILARVLKADEVWIWTDVDGVYSADPRTNHDAEILSHLTYTQAERIAHQGAKVLYPKTFAPLHGTEIVVRVKNTFNPDFVGTRISHI